MNASYYSKDGIFCMIESPTTFSIKLFLMSAKFELKMIKIIEQQAESISTTESHKSNIKSLKKSLDQNLLSANFLNFAKDGGSKGPDDQSSIILVLQFLKSMICYRIQFNKQDFSVEKILDYPFSGKTSLSKIQSIHNSSILYYNQEEGEFGILTFSLNKENLSKGKNNKILKLKKACQNTNLNENYPITKIKGNILGTSAETVNPETSEKLIIFVVKDIYWDTIICWNMTSVKEPKVIEKFVETYKWIYTMSKIMSKFEFCISSFNNDVYSIEIKNINNDTLQRLIVNDPITRFISMKGYLIFLYQKFDQPDDSAEVFHQYNKMLVCDSNNIAKNHKILHFDDFFYDDILFIVLSENLIFLGQSYEQPIVYKALQKNFI